MIPALAGTVLALAATVAAVYWRGRVSAARAECARWLDLAGARAGLLADADARAREASVRHARQLDVLRAEIRELEADSDACSDAPSVRARLRRLFDDAAPATDPAPDLPADGTASDA